MGRVTLIDRGRLTKIDANVDGESVFLHPDAVNAALGWELKPEGFCRDDVCIPVSDEAEVVTDGGVSLYGLAELLRRPLAVDIDERAAYLGRSATTRTAELRSLRAPDFRLPDLEGKIHALSDYRGKKVLLAAYASW